MAAAASKAWIVAGSVGVVEALKDQGFGRWNHALRSIHQHANSNIRAVSQPTLLSNSSPTTLTNALEQLAKAKQQQSEESLRKVYVPQQLGS